MKKEEFLNRLGYLLQDVPEEDKSEALAYYLDCIEEAGEEHEEEAIANFGSPERVAAIIRADLSGNLEEGGSFTERGYQDERFREPNFEVVERGGIPKEEEDHSYERNYEENRRSAPIDTEPAPKAKRHGFWKALLIGVLLIVLSPFILGALGIVFAGIATVAGILLGALAAVFCVTAMAFLLGVALAAVGVIFVLATPFDGLFLIGIALAGFGFGLLGVALLALCFWLAGIAARAVIKGGKALFGFVAGKGKEKRR